MNSNKVLRGEQGFSFMIPERLASTALIFGIRDSEVDVNGLRYIKSKEEI